MTRRRFRGLSYYVERMARTSEGSHDTGPRRCPKLMGCRNSGFADWRQKPRPLVNVNPLATYRANGEGGGMDRSALDSLLSGCHED